jgi:hypothetical protein
MEKWLVAPAWVVPFSGCGGVEVPFFCELGCPSVSESAMPDQPQSPENDRFKAEMPHIPGVGPTATKTSGPRPSGLLVGGGLAAVLAALFVGGRLISKSPRAEAPSAPAAQIEVPVDAPSVPDLPIPMATESNPVIAQVGDLSKPWDSRKFTFRNRNTGENVAALLIRLPGGSAAQASAYWALVLKAAYSSCQLEYIQDIARLRNDYGYRTASHPMLANPCSRTVYDPTKYASIPGGALARGAIVQGPDLRPPLGIEVHVKDRAILAVRME